MTTDATGAVFHSTQYKPFGTQYGIVAEPVNQRLKFTGQWNDATTGLYYLYRRFYDPEIGRFLSQDPVLGHLTAPQSLVRYVYTVNNPLRCVDPTGEDWWNPLTWGQDISGALAAAGTAVADWWSSSAWLDKLDMAMMIVGFIPGVDVISDAYFLGRALVDVAQGKASWPDVAIGTVMAAFPHGRGISRCAGGHCRAPNADPYTSHK